MNNINRVGTLMQGFALMGVMELLKAQSYLGLVFLLTGVSGTVLAGVALVVKNRDIKSTAELIIALSCTCFLSMLSLLLSVQSLSIDDMRAVGALMAAWFLFGALGFTLDVGNQQVTMTSKPDARSG